MNHFVSKNNIYSIPIRSLRRSSTSIHRESFDGLWAEKPTQITISPELELRKQGAKISIDPPHKTNFFHDNLLEFVEDEEKVESFGHKGYMTELIENKFSRIHNKINENERD